MMLKKDIFQKYYSKKHTCIYTILFKSLGSLRKVPFLKEWHYIFIEYNFKLIRKQTIYIINVVND